MDSKEVVGRLISGSEAINRMRRDIDFIVHTVMSLLDKSDLIPWSQGLRGRPHSAETTFSDLMFRWVVKEDAPGHLQVDCWLIFYYGNSLAYSTQPGYGKLKMRDVQRVYEALPSFVEGMAKTFPCLSERWQPLLDASGM